MFLHLAWSGLRAAVDGVTLHRSAAPRHWAEGGLRAGGEVRGKTKQQRNEAGEH